MKKIFSVILILTTFFSFATQRPVPANYATIQLALNACSMGDTVVVQQALI